MFLSFPACCGTTLSVLFIAFYPLSEAKVKNITAELDKRREKNSGGVMMQKMIS